jgi:hypothetical protein
MEQVQLKVNATVVANNRKALNNVGKQFGGQFFRGSMENTNPKHEEEVIASQNNHDLDLVLNRSPRRFKVTGTDIVAVEVGEDATGASLVYINRGRKIQVGDKEFSTEARIPISPDMRIASDVTDEVLAEALKGDKSKIFADPDALVEKCNALNDMEISRLENLKTSIEKQIQMIRSTKNTNIDKARKYKSERTTVVAEVIEND